MTRIGKIARPNREIRAQLNQSLLDGQKASSILPLAQWAAQRPIHSSSRIRWPARQCRRKDFWEWTQRPEIREKLFPDRDKGLPPEILEKIERELRLM